MFLCVGEGALFSFFEYHGVTSQTGILHSSISHDFRFKAVVGISARRMCNDDSKVERI